MALEDIFRLKYRHLHNKCIPFSPVEDTFTSLFMMDNYNLRWRTLDTLERSCHYPMHFFIPPLPNCVNRPCAQPCRPKQSMPVCRPFHLSHGTTTLGFIFQGGVIAAADTRASAGGQVACPAVSKITPIHSHLVVTSSGSGADCMLWERILMREIRLYELRHRRRLSIHGTAKLLWHMLHPFKGTDVCVALTLCGWDKETINHNSSTVTQESLMTDCSSLSGVHQDISAQSPLVNMGPKLIYVCSDGAQLQGNVFSVGSGSPYAYGILDGELRWSLSKEEAISLAREAVFRATHRDAYSGNNVDLFHITAQGWKQRQREDLKEEYYRKKLEREKEMGMRQTVTNAAK